MLEVARSGLLLVLDGSIASPTAKELHGSHAYTNEELAGELADQMAKNHDSTVLNWVMASRHLTTPTLTKDRAMLRRQSPMGQRTM
jgi:hypothetical protein